MKKVFARYFRIKEEPLWIVIAFFIFEGFCLFTLCYSAFFLANVKFVCLCLISMFFVFFPWCVQRWLHLEFTAGMKFMIFIMAVMALMAGYVYNLYHIIPFYDKLLHTYFGFIFAPFCFMIPMIADRQSDKKSHPALCALTAFMAVVTVSVIWELIEFGVDHIFHMDMQRDSLIRYIASYDLPAEGVGITRKLADIVKTVVYTADGQKVVIDGGYLDVGLIDSMTDMLVAVIGSGLFSLLYIYKKGKLVGFMIPKLLPWKREEYQAYLKDNKAADKIKS